MSKYLFLILILIGRICLACDAPDVQRKMAAVLYQDKDFKELTCGAIPNCDAEVMAERMEFTTIPVHGIPFEVCSAETAANVKNRFTGIFTIDASGVRLKMIVFDTDIRPFYENGRTGLIVDLVTDDVSESMESEFFAWNGKDFIHVKDRRIQPGRK